MDNLIKFFTEIGKLKDIERSGWVVEGIRNPESVADHSFRTALAVLVLGNGRKDLDLNRAVKIALAHDIEESQTGDILIDWKIKGFGEKAKRLNDFEKHGITKEEKMGRGLEAMKNLSSILGESGKEIFDLWKEYEEGQTKEAVFVKSVETFEMLLQAYEYEKEQNIKLGWFEHQQNWDNIKDEQIKKLVLRIVEKRKEDK